MLQNKRPTGFTKAVRIETQEAAKYNFERRMKEQQDKIEFKARVDAKIAEATKPVKVEPNKVGKTVPKVESKEEAPKTETKKGK